MHEDGNCSAVSSSGTDTALSASRASKDGEQIHEAGDGSAASSSGADTALSASRVSNKALNILKVHMSSPVKSLGKDAPEWEVIELGVDSGASETVIGPDMISNVQANQ